MTVTPPLSGGVPRKETFVERYKYWLIVGGVAVSAIVLLKVLSRIRTKDAQVKPREEWGHIEAPLRGAASEEGVQQEQAHAQPAQAHPQPPAGYQHIGGAMPSHPQSQYPSVQPHLYQPQVPQQMPQQMMQPPAMQPPPYGQQPAYQMPPQPPQIQQMQPPPVYQMPMQATPVQGMGSGAGAQGQLTYSPPSVPPASAGAPMMGAGSGDVPFAGDLPTQQGNQSGFGGGPAATGGFGGGGFPMGASSGGSGGGGYPMGASSGGSGMSMGMPTGYTPLN